MVSATAKFRAFPAAVISVVDGDTIHASCDLGFRVSSSIKFRLAHINAPEKSSGAPGEAATARLTELCPAGSNVELRCFGEDKYGRWLVEIVLADGRTANDVLLAEKLAVPYEGGLRT